MADASQAVLDQPMKTWTHPTGQNPQSVLIVALGPTKSDLLDMTTAHEPPELVMDVDEVWGINAGCNHLSGRVAYDVLWVMDYLDGEERKKPRYGEMLRRWMDRHRAPLITSQAGAWKENPHVYEFPLDEVIAKVGDTNAYFHNSLPYMLAYAWCIGVKSLVVWGADYSHERSKRREEDRANAEYWIGYVRAKGVEVWLPSSTTLCNTSSGPYFYGYRDQPEIADHA
jgi:hypothetical protein